mgnify:CR=1 FL=1|jgi:hypothetical protein
MNSELEKLIEKYRITVNGLADLESGYDQVIKERGFVTLNGLLVSGEENAPAGESAENAVNTETHSPSGEENTPVADPAPVEPTPVVPAPSEPATEQPGVTPVPSDPAVSGDTNLGTEVASGEEEDSTEDPTEGEPAAGGKPKKKKK